MRQNVTAFNDRGASLAGAEDKPRWMAFRAGWDQFGAADERMREFIKKGEAAKALEISTGEVRRIFNEEQKEVVALVGIERAQMAQASVAAGEQYERSRLLLISAVVASVLIAVGAGFWISLNISRGLRRTISSPTRSPSVTSIRQSRHHQRRDQGSGRFAEQNDRPICGRPQERPTRSPRRSQQRYPGALRQGRPRHRAANG